jgi:hypothetical protein
VDVLRGSALKTKVRKTKENLERCGVYKLLAGWQKENAENFVKELLWNNYIYE